MNIMFIANKSETGGAPKSMQSLILKLKEKNNIIVITPKKEKIYNFCKENHIKVVKLNYDSFIIYSGNTKIKKFFRKLIIPILRMKHKLLNRVALRRLEKNIDLNNIDIIHTNFYRDDIGGIIAKKYHKVHIVHLREFGDKDYDCFSLFNNKIKYMLNYTTKFIAISEAIRKYYIALGIPKNKIVRIYNGIENKKIKSHVNRNDNKYKILMLGNLTEEKGQMDILMSLSLLEKKEMNKFNVDFYGKSDEKYKSKILSFIEKNNLKNNVKIFDYIDNVYEKLKDYDIGLMCSQSEAFGRVTIEYMAAGLITIASNTGANPEIISNNEDGFLYIKNDINSLRDILKNIDNVNFELISKRAKEKVEKNFTYEINAKNCYNLYKQCLNETKE